MWSRKKAVNSDGNGLRKSAFCLTMLRVKKRGVGFWCTAGDVLVAHVSTDGSWRRGLGCGQVSKGEELSGAVV